ncbi:unnamed protein product [Mytilus coruscus]|uniref:Integrase catalytic domain-containing protein n=1 Tax=Mytilus coruscus TaxID=42192 RepID=A0A6J8BVX8_MYTCO|nr:unnamed protein product [Mytilus coruscus]
MYRATTHSTTGASPAELLFGRQIKTKLPELGHSKEDIEVRDKDRERKEKGKMYTDEKRKAVKSELQPGDKVLVKQNKENKLSTTFHHKPLLLLEKNGNSVLIQSDQGVKYRRNVTHVKKFEQQNVSNENRFNQKSNENVLNRNVYMSNENLSQERSVLDESISNENMSSENQLNLSMNETPDVENSQDRIDKTNEVTTAISRPTRNRKPPARLQDYILN